MHFLRANLHFQRLATVQHRGVQRLVQIRPRHGDVILEPAGHRMPDVVHHSQRRITTALAIGDHTYRQQIVNLLQSAVLAQQFSVQRIQSLYARFQLRGDSAFHQLALNGGLHFFQKPAMNLRFVRHLFLQPQERFRLQIPERQILQFVAHVAHAQAMRDRRVNIQSLARNSLLLGILQIFKRAHVMQPVGQLHQHHAHVIHHGQKHLADVFDLPRFRRHHVQPADFCDSLHQPRHFRTKPLFDPRERKFRVFHHVMQQRGRQSSGVHAHVRQDMRHFQQVR